MSVAITDAELVLMQLLWKHSPLTAREITEHLQGETGWHRKTVNTLLSRLARKSAVERDKSADGITVWSPLIDRKAWQQSATSSFVDDHFDGEIAPLVASFAESRKLDAKQAAELQNLLRELFDDD